MTRARSELYLTSAEDYGGPARAQGEPVRAGGPRPAQGRRAPVPRTARWRSSSATRPRRPAGGGEPVPLAPGRRDRWSATARWTTTRPARSSTATSTSCASRSGATTPWSTAARSTPPSSSTCRRRAAGNYTALEDLLRAFDDAWLNQGFLTREHEEQRKRAGGEALTRFYHEEEAAGGRPAGVEKEFGFALGADHVRGRFDRVDETPGAR